MVRTTKQRIVQTLAYELGGLIIATPLFSYFVEFSLTESLLFIVVLSVFCILWTGLHNTIYDHIEWRLIQRIASDRSGLSRVLHIFSLEASSILIGVPLILLVSDVSLLDAVLLDIGLTFGYMVYGILFYWVFDFLHPIKAVTARGELHG